MHYNSVQAKDKLKGSHHCSSAFACLWLVATVWTGLEDPGITLQIYPYGRPLEAELAPIVA